MAVGRARRAPAGAFHTTRALVSHRAMGQEPFEALMTTHHGEIYRYVWRMTGRASEADDLSQETFVRAYRAYKTLPADANKRAWLFAIATNLCRNHFRSERRRRVAYAGVRDTAHAADDDGPEGAARFQEARALTEAVIDGLPMKQRLAFILRKLHDLDYEVIGQSLDCSAESARAHVFQALRKIRRTLNDHAVPGTEPRP
jgi:RNA polymerase sigma-70 factor, ECF subfamily